MLSSAPSLPDGGGAVAGTARRSAACTPSLGSPDGVREGQMPRWLA